MVTAIPAQVKDNHTSNIRPFDPLRDMPAVVDLIEIGFRDELDPQGWKMLEQMRKIARRGWWFNLFSPTSFKPAGFVWVENRQVVGNLSLRHTVPTRNGGWLIGNVVVHPDYRGRHIGRALVDTAVEAAAEQKARWVGLEVRENNHIARSLYEKVGFRSVGITQHLLRSSNHPHPLPSNSQIAWRACRPQDNRLWIKLSNHCYERKQREVLEIRPSMYTFGGWERKFDLWLQRQREWAWIKGKPEPIAAVRVKTDRGYHFHTWDMLIHPEETERQAQQAVAQASSITGRKQNWPIVTIVPSQPYLIKALKSVGFGIHRTLVQMVLNL